ncbi:MAG: hypothetical protein ACXVBE_17375 [Bdellovibrionota bacterium]
MLRTIFFFFSLLSFAAPSFALSPKEVKDSYVACMNFLKLQPAQQIQAAKNSGYSLKQVLWACRLQKRTGLAQLLENERDYQNGSSDSSGGSYIDQCYQGSSSVVCTDRGPGSLWSRSGCFEGNNSYSCTGR